MDMNLTRLFYHARLTAATATGMGGVLPGRLRPSVVNIKLTENCNARCKTCDYWQENHPNELSTERVVDLLAEINRAGIGSVRFTGGEPLLRRDLFDILTTVTEGDFERVCLATNGLLLPRFAGKINSSPITHVSVSIDAMGETNDRLRGVEGYFATAMKGLESLNVKRKVVSTVTSALIPDLEELILYCKARGYAFDINLPDYNLYFFSSGNVRETVESLWPDDEEVNRAMEILTRHGVINSRLERYARYYLKNRKISFPHCVLGFLESNIDSTGNLRTGCNVFRPVGNVRDSSLTELLDSEDYARSVRKMYDLKCRGCVCGYAVSVTYRHPLNSLGYIKRRLPGNGAGRRQ